MGPIACHLGDNLARTEKLLDEAVAAGWVRPCHPKEPLGGVPEMTELYTYVGRHRLDLAYG